MKKEKTSLFQYFYQLVIDLFSTKQPPVEVPTPIKEPPVWVRMEDQLVFETPITSRYHQFPLLVFFTADGIVVRLKNKPEVMVLISSSDVDMKWERVHPAWVRLDLNGDVTFKERFEVCSEQEFEKFLFATSLSEVKRRLGFHGPGSCPIDKGWRHSQF